VRPLSLRVHLRTLLFACAAVLGTVAMTTAVLFAGAGGLSTDNFGWIALTSMAAIAPLAFLAGPWSATGAYAAVFWCFHFGLVTVIGLGLVDPQTMSRWDQAWALGPFAGDAALVALLGSLGFVSGVSFVHAWWYSTAPRPVPARAEGAHSHGTAGAAMVVAAAAVWCAVVWNTMGPAGFFASYMDYLQATADYAPVMSAVWLGLGLGIVLAVTGRPGAVRTTAVVVFAAFALVALPIGLRGEIMFPSIGAFVASARCGRMVSWRKAGALAAGLLLLIPAIREIRTTGLQGLSDTVLELRFFDAFVEMGGSLHPVEKVVRWHAEGEPLEQGGSYWAPIERAAARFLPDLVGTAAEDDMRIMNVLVIERVGAIGFSPVAEAYRNFGAPGAVIVLALFGAALAGLDKVRDPRAAVLLIATVYVPVLMNVRNSFISVPAHFAAGVVVILLLGAMRHVSGSVLCRPYARAPYVRSKV
jgi:hypothetical protein